MNLARTFSSIWAFLSTRQTSSVSGGLRVLLERDADASEAEQPLEEVAGVDLRAVVLPSDLLAGLGGARLEVQVVGRDRHVVEETMQPGDEDRQQADDRDEQVARAADGEGQAA